MKKFIIKTFVFAVAVYILLAAMDYLYSKRCQVSSNIKYQFWSEMLAGGIDADALVVSNSRMRLVKTDILDSTLQTRSYSIGRDGFAFNRQIHVYNLYLKHNSKPKIIIQNVDMYTLQYEVGFDKRQFFPFLWDPEVRSELREEPFTMEERFLPFYRYEMNLFRSGLRKGKKHNTRPPKGPLWEDWDPLEYPRTQRHRFNITERSLITFIDYITKAQEDGIKVILVHAPIVDYMLENALNTDGMMRFYEGFAQEHGIPFLDFSKMDICHDTTYFANALHLNDRGLKVFTDTLAESIREVLSPQEDGEWSCLTH